jgi:hypothetical protein
MAAVIGWSDRLVLTLTPAIDCHRSARELDDAAYADVAAKHCTNPLRMRHYLLCRSPVTGKVAEAAATLMKAGSPR